MSNKNLFKDLERMYSALSQFESTLIQFNNENYFRMVDNLSKLFPRNMAIEEVVIINF